MPRLVVPICSRPSLASPAWSSSLQAADVDAAGTEAVELVGEYARVDHHAVADDAGLARVEDPAGDEVERPLLVPTHDRVAGVVAALEADDHVGLLGEQVDDLPLALVAPLGAHYHESRHGDPNIGIRDHPAKPGACGFRRPARPSAGRHP
jgi:hypothetical protein